MRSLVTALRARLGDQASISGGNERVFIYTSTAESAHAIAQEARDVLVQQAVASPEWVSAEIWLPTAERWRDGTGAPPARIARSYENVDKYQQAKEAERSVATGIPAWRVKITPRSGHEANAVREYLTDRGLRIRASRTRLFTWVNCEDDAHALSAALTGAGLMTPGTRIEIEPQKPVLSRGSGFPFSTSCHPERPLAGRPQPDRSHHDPPKFDAERGYVPAQVPPPRPAFPGRQCQAERERPG